MPKAPPHASHGMASMNEGLSAMADSIVYCTQSFFPASSLIPELQPCLEVESSGPLHSPCVEWCRTSVAMLLLLSIDGIYTAGKPPAAQAIKTAHLIDPIHAPTRVLT